jgi:hypothetical protein
MTARTAPSVPSPPRRSRARSRFVRVSAGAAVVLMAAAVDCDNDLEINPVHQLPVAVASIVRNGQSFNAEMDGGAAELMFPFMGSPVTITLDGSLSYDPAGSIVAYHWLSGTLADGGTELPDEGGTMLRWVPPGAAPNWPGDGEMPQVQLGEGIWSFVLWVVDNHGSISAPSTVTVTIGNVVNPVVQQCAQAVLASEPESCRQCVCMQSAMCHAAVVATACDQSCWDLVNCTAAHCPDFATMAAKGDYSCLTTNCSAYLAGSTAATPVAPCFNACTAQCTSSGDGGAAAGAEGGAPGDGGADDGGGD